MDWALFLTFLAACGAASATGAMFQPGPWYTSLTKPSWTPPNWLFPVAWSILYLCMAASAARVAVLPDSGQAMAFWALQIAVNTLWTPIFFGLRRMRAAMVVMVGLWLSVAATMLAFFQLDLIAGLLFVPYLVWVTVASALNFSVLRLNPGVQPVTL
ncbi:MAG: tryptophan-rich sensory protein TspO [Paracoccaceae bacterium]